MNKKRLSVVMAGAMLASSVAPVLAATETVVNNSEKGLLIKRLRELVSGTVFSDIKDNDTNKLDKNGNHDFAGESAYYVKIDTGSGAQFYRLADIAAMETAIKGATTATIEVFDRGFVVKDGVVYNHALEDMKVAKTYTTDELKTVYDNFTDGNHKADFSDVVYKMNFTDGVLTVTLRTADEEDKYKVLTLKEGDKELEFKTPLDKSGNEIIENQGEWKNFDRFAEKVEGISKGDNIPTKLIEKITLTDVDATYETVLSNLYDGLFLTENGQKLLDTLKEYDKKGFIVDDEISADIIDTGRGIYELRIKLEKTVNAKTTKQVVVVKSNNKEQLSIFADGLAPQVPTSGHATPVRKFPVQKLAGDDRYETAVKVAKENADIKTVSENGNIVLVNGGSLVDGLAAAPLAASVSNMNNSNGGTALAGHFVAPILLTGSDSLPKATKDYMKEVIAHQQVGALNKVTVYLVGGEAVISKTVENELKEIGFRVVRAGGKDREETSLKVAKLMQDDTTAGDGYDSDDMSEAFLVGANGEADAMSIASYAADKKAPIIVESVHGISDESIEFLKGYKNIPNGLPTTIIGGETAVSKATEEKLVAEKVKVERVFGNKRQDTNAEVIKRFYSNNQIKHVLVSKDGVANKSHLIDALTATSVAAKYHSPIVLASNELTKGQINELELKAEATGVYVYQIGEGVAPTVIKTIADKLGLAK